MFICIILSEKERVQNNIKKISLIFYYFIIFIILFIGITARCKLYFANYPFWHDEMLLILNLFDIKGIDVFMPMENGQKVPPFFLLLLAFFVNVLCKSDTYNFFILHFIPFISGIFSLFGFYFLLERIFNFKLPVILGLLLFSVNIPLIYFSDEFKPYSTDVLVCVLLLIYYEYFKIKNITNKQVIIYTIAASMLVLFSFPVIIIIPAMLFAKYIEDKHVNFKSLWILAGIIIPCLYLWLSDINTYNFMNNYWVDCGGLNDVSFATFKNIFYGFYKYFSGNINYEYTFAVAVIFMISICSMIIKRKYNCVILLIILIALGASFLKVYPLADRVSLYIFPVFIIVFLKLFDMMNSLWEADPGSYCVKAFVLFLSLFFIFQLDKNPYLNAEIQKPVEFNTLCSYHSKRVVKDFTLLFLDKYKDNEQIFYTFNLGFSIKFYNRLYNINKKLNFVSKELYTNKKELEEDFYNFLENKSGAKTLWLTGIVDVLPDGYWFTDEFAEQELQKRKYVYKKYKIEDIFYYKILF